MDLRKLKSLIDLVSDSEISELEISEGEDRVKIVRSNKNQSNVGKKLRETSKVDYPQEDSFLPEKTDNNLDLIALFDLSEICQWLTLKILLL